MSQSRELVKLYYRIGEVATIVGVQPHVLRYWETEFRTIRPQKSHKGQRVYSRRDVEKLLRVKDLLKNQGFTIAGAKRKLREPERGEAAVSDPSGASSQLLIESAPAPPAASAAPPPAVAFAVAAPLAVMKREAARPARNPVLVKHALLAIREDIVAMIEGLDSSPRRPKLPSVPGRGPAAG